MKTKQARIRWTHPKNKVKPLPVGIEYFPHIVRMDDVNREHWSVRFFITEENRQGEGVIELKMLVDNVECIAFFETLKPKTEFVLFEGTVEVARGYVL